MEPRNSLFRAAAILSTLVLVTVFASLHAYARPKDGAREQKRDPARVTGPRLVVRDREAALPQKLPVSDRLARPEKSKGRCAGKTPQNFTEVEVTLDEQFTLDYLSALQLAPGSEPQMAGEPNRAIMQLSAEQVKALVNQGADVQILRRFVLIEGTEPKGRKKDVGLSPIPQRSPQANSRRVHGEGSASPFAKNAYLASIDDANCYGENVDDVYIPDCPNEWVYSAILISCAPGGAMVSSIDVHYYITHGWVGDLIVEVSNQQDTCPYRLYDAPGTSGSYLDETVYGISVCNGEPVNQWWVLWARDTYDCLDDGYIRDWWIKVYYGGGGATPPHDECPNSIPVYDGVPYDGNTIGATGDFNSTCSYYDQLDVWHTYTPSANSRVTISLANSLFDTTLSVFDGCGGNEIACNDDICFPCASGPHIYQSELTMFMEGGQTYYIRVAGWGGETGDYELLITENPCLLPDEPTGPYPPDEANNVLVDIVLSWGNGGLGALLAEKRGTADLGPKREVAAKVIYGSDDRQDEYEVTDPCLLAVGDSVALFCPTGDLIDNGNGTFTLDTIGFGDSWGGDLCLDEPYYDQPVPYYTPLCSAFLVAPDIVATAGHCVDRLMCGDIALVFGFVMLDATTPQVTVSASEVYYCSEVLANMSGCSDHALVRLDREVVGHDPIPVRSDSKVPNGEPLYSIGHPMGLPLKYAGGAIVRDNSPLCYFQANLDTYSGNSGCPIISSNTYEVEGVLVRGNVDFVWNSGDGCYDSNVCPDSGCPGSQTWEDVTRTTAFGQWLPVGKYDVYFDDVNPPTKLVGSDMNEPWCDPCEGNLMPGTTYYWRVEARNACDKVVGPNWMFTTEIPPVITQWDIEVVHGGGIDELRCEVQDGYIEPRTSGITKLAVQFDRAMKTSVTNPSVISIDGVNGGAQPAPSLVSWESDTCMIITFGSALPDEDAYTITVGAAVQSAAGAALGGDRDICLRALKGDANGSGAVSDQDLLAIRPHAGDPVTCSNARYDINCSGAINAQDLLAARVYAGNSAPACPGS